MWKVVAADDEGYIREALQKLINWEKMDCSLESVVSDGQELLEKIRGEMPDIVITDIQMPGVDGLEVCKYVYETCPETQVIILTAYSDFEYAKRAIKYSVCEYVLKISIIDELPLAVEKAIGKLSRLKKEIEIQEHTKAEEPESLLDQIEQYLEENWKALISNLLFQEDYALAQSLLKDIYNLLENDFSASELFDALLMTVYCCLKLCDFHSDLLQVCFKELHDLSLITVISPEQIRLYHLLQAKHYLAVGQYLALIKQTDELRIIDPKLRHIRAIGIKHQYGINNCILSLKRGIKRFPENTLLKYSYYDHLLSISINKGDFKAAKANIDILKTYKEILSLEDQIHLEFNELTVLFYSKEMKDTRQLLGLCGKAYQNNLHVELSRSYNLLGQFFWTKKDWKKAIDAFDAAADLQDRTGHQTYRWIAKTNLALINLELRNNPDAVMYAKEIILGYYSSKRDKFKRIFTADNKMMYTDFFTDKEIVSFLLMLRILYKNDYTGYTQIIETVKQPDIAVLPKEFEHFISRSFVSMLKKTYYYVDGNFMIKC